MKNFNLFAKMRIFTLLIFIWGGIFICVGESFAQTEDYLVDVSQTQSDFVQSWGWNNNTYVDIGQSWVPQENNIAGIALQMCNANEDLDWSWTNYNFRIIICDSEPSSRYECESGHEVYREHYDDASIVPLCSNTMGEPQEVIFEFSDKVELMPDKKYWFMTYFGNYTFYHWARQGVATGDPYLDGMFYHFGKSKYEIGEVHPELEQDLWFKTFYQEDEPEKLDPVIIVPGIMGSWNVSGEWELDPITHIYDDLWEALKLAGYEEGVNLFAFPYQWRLSNVYTAGLLKEKIQQVKDITGAEKVDLITHSMGGLVARSYAQGNDYQDDIDQLIFLATPHLGATKDYLTWEGGELSPKYFDNIYRALLTLEAHANGYTGIYTYVRNLPMQSVRELLPIYDYLRDSESLELKQYSDGYPINSFLELLNNPNELNKLAPINITNIIANSGEDSTIDIIRIEDKPFIDGRWEDGYPEGYDTPFTDHGLEYGSGDIVVPARSNMDFLNLEPIVINSDHEHVISDAQKEVIKELTGTEPIEEVKQNIFTKFFIVRIFSPADFVVIAPDGKKLGKDFDNNIAVNEIPNAFYSGFDTEMEFAVIPDPIDGEYSVELQGTGDGEYTISVSDISEEENINKEFTSVITNEQVHDFVVDYNGTSEESISDLVPGETVPQINIDGLMAKIEQMYEQGDIDKKGDKNKLINKLANLQKRLANILKNKENINGKVAKVEKNKQLKDEKLDQVIRKINNKIEILENNKQDVSEQKIAKLNKRIDSKNKNIKKTKDKKIIQQNKKNERKQKLNKKIVDKDVKRQEIIEKVLNNFIKLLDKIKDKDRIETISYDIIINSINYLKTNL